MIRRIKADLRTLEWTDLAEVAALCGFIASSVRRHQDGGDMMGTPKLVMGHIVVMTSDGGEGILYDEAVVHLERDEDSEIEIHCPNAPEMAERIVKAVNSHDALVAALAIIADIAEGSGTLNSFPNIAKIARGALASIKEAA